MADINEIARALKEVEADLARCARCGMCLAVCPLYYETGREADAARGKLALVDGLADKLFDSSGGVSERLGRCLLCGSCSAICPNGVNASDIFLKARMIIAQASRLPSTQKYLLKKTLGNPAAFDRFMKWCGLLQKWATKPENPVIGTASFRLPPANLKKRHFIPQAPVAFLKNDAAKTVSAVSSGPAVLFFVGCLIDRFFPNIAHAAMKVFDHHQINAVIPRPQGCCGMPSASAGDRDTLKQLIRHHMALFGQTRFDTLVTACATCTHVIKHLWPQMTDDHDTDLKGRVIETAEKTMDICQFMVMHAGIKAPLEKGGTNETIVTYHDPCHLKKSLGVHIQPRILINASPSYRLVEMEEPDRCCGMGGSFNLSHYELSRQIGQHKADAIAATGADTVATGCPACMMQMADMLSRSGRNLSIRHPVEIYAEGLPGR